VLWAFDELPRISETPPLASGAVDLWCFAYQDVVDSGEIASFDRLMSSAEIARCRALVGEHARNAFRATRALVRAALSFYTSERKVWPWEWRFDTTPHGRPFVASSHLIQPLSFSLSNTAGLVACAVSRHEKIGVDVETVEPAKALDALAVRYFSPIETRALGELPASERVARFFAYWTLKESYIKAKGLGLSLALDRFAMRVETGRAPEIRFDPRLVDDSSRWRFARIDVPGARPSATAIAVETGGAPLTLRASWCPAITLPRRDAVAI
jgi:4'-phosphopantetheinyl transferase